MPLNKVKMGGNMYGFITHTWNPIKGKCEHDCCYCYMKRFGKPLPELRLDEKDLQTDLGEGNFIFVGSSTDMFADNVPLNWISEVLLSCGKFKNKYLFQTKNPDRMMFYSHKGYVKKSIWGLTLETNRDHLWDVSKSPFPRNRVRDFISMNNQTKMVTIEPIMAFDLLPFVEMIKRCDPEWVNIGADSTNGRKYDLPEPTYAQVEDLIAELQKFTEVKLKKNLNRLKNK